eukprot:gb/GEZN01013022.1/.p1 GENE.gb/GEZN01013022.1/~~gb/GEZN01013022.1/.p1  ORF type:complete len:294 (-),score=26.66 gb/GEZN01013022.1/:23-904(-)
MISPLTFFLAAIAFANKCSNCMDTETEHAKFRTFYPQGDTLNSCTIFVLGVGLGMRADSYDRLGNMLSAKGHVVVMQDHNPGVPLKLDSKKWSTAFISTRMNLDGWLSDASDYSKCKGPRKWVVGGHSAGGLAAANALASLPADIHGFLGLDPYGGPYAKLDEGAQLRLQRLPVLVWGFYRATCGVYLEHAAVKVYNAAASSEHMIGQQAFFKVNNSALTCPTYDHCGFTDTGCLGPICAIKCPEEAIHLTHSVSASVDRLVARIKNEEAAWIEDDWQIRPPFVPHIILTTRK